MKKYHYFLAAFALICIIGGSIKGALSYFTTYAEARGGVVLKLGEETEISEEYDGTKKLTIKNNHKDVSVFIRAKAFISEDYKDSLKYDKSVGWRDGGDGYWYYGDPDSKVLAPGASTETPLIVEFAVPEEAVKDDKFNVVVIYESIPVIYDEAGNPVEDWSQKITSVKEEGGN